MGVMGVFYFLLVGVFVENICIFIMELMLWFLKFMGFMFMMNIYFYFFYCDDLVNIFFGYVLFLNNVIGVDDFNMGFYYLNLFDVMLDLLIFVMKNLGYYDILVIVMEIGWLSIGEEWEKVVGLENVKMFNNNFLKYVKSGKGMLVWFDIII